jgi:hypothetical protein
MWPHICAFCPLPQEPNTANKHHSPTRSTRHRRVPRNASRAIRSHSPVLWPSRPSILLSSHWCEEACPKASSKSHGFLPFSAFARVGRRDTCRVLLKQCLRLRVDNRWGDGSDIRKYSLRILGTNKGSYGNVASRPPLEHKLLESPMKPTSRHSYSRFAPFVKGIVEFVPACTVQWQPSACSWGRTRRGFSVWNVLEVRCKDLIQADQA